jgi:hypothetical protein
MTTNIKHIMKTTTHFIIDSTFGILIKINIKERKASKRFRHLALGDKISIIRTDYSNYLIFCEILS